ncbi:BON domain-containing protein [Gimesia algae]|uniref:BON domain protein n=1 Tax=Gimesia algae TaxID=2527971 RepID=A0A517VF70_9PLAN|nr:BON domain protein [Gimesia algae]
MKLQNKTRIQFNSSPDRQLKLRIRRILHSAGYAALNAIRIEVHHGEVYLEGIVTSYFMKQMAQVRILSLNEVRKIHNFLIVETAGPQSEIKLITDQAKAIQHHSQPVPRIDRSNRPESVDVCSENI